jgi:hypothetical protein
MQTALQVRTKPIEGILKGALESILKWVAWTLEFVFLGDSCVKADVNKLLLLAQFGAAAFHRADR